MSGKRVAALCALLIVCLLAPATWGQALWAYYPIREGDLSDQSGNKHDGTAVDGAAPVYDPVRGWVVAFNRQPELPSRVNCGTDDPSAGGQLTVAAWMLWRGTNGNWQGVAGKSFSYDDRRWILQLRDTDGMIQWGGTDKSSLHIWSTVAPEVEEWQHIAGTCDGKLSKIYINGENVGEGPGGFAAGTAAKANVTLGFGEDRSDYDESLNGSLDDIYIFTRALGRTQVQDLAKGILPRFDKARDPDPVNGAVDVTAAILRWTAGDGGSLHHIYFGTTPELGQAAPTARIAKTTWVAPVELEPGVTYYWRVDEVQKDGKVITGDLWSFMVQALTAYLPSPADEAVDASVSPDLTWRPGQEAMQHQIYFGSSFDAVSQGAPETDKGLRDAPDANFAPGALESVTTYYWRVDEVTMDTVVTGPVWSFTTCLPVDDFESYTDEVGYRIFQTWIDGTGYTEPKVVAGNGTGSTVGHGEPPFAELKIVHSGLQSMPMDYNNVDSPNYSEAQRTFASPADWTINGANTLVLYVRGKATNKPGELYLKVKDASNRQALITHDDSLAVTQTAWIQWKIPLAVLSGLGVDPTGIKQVSIGVTNPAAGAGSLFVDDIQVIKEAPGQ